MYESSSELKECSDDPEQRDEFLKDTLVLERSKDLLLINHVKELLSFPVIARKFGIFENGFCGPSGRRIVTFASSRRRVNSSRFRAK